MASSELVRSVMKSVSDDLKGRRVSFGDRQLRAQSYYAHLLGAHGQEGGELRFTRYVWDKAVQLKIIPVEADGIEDSFGDPQEYPDPSQRPRLAADALLEQYPTCGPQLESVTNYVDLYALWVESLKFGARGAEVRGDLSTAITTWAKGHIPSSCLKKMNLSAATGHLLDTLKQQVSEYRFDEDFLLSWMRPNLTDAMMGLLGTFRPEMTPELRARLQEKAANILEGLCDSFGIYGLDDKELVERALFFVITAEEAKYDYYKPQMDQWALSVLKEQIRTETYFRCQPRMDMRDKWGQVITLSQKEMEDGELKMRETFIKTFLRLV